MCLCLSLRVELGSQISLKNGVDSLVILFHYESDPYGSKSLPDLEADYLNPYELASRMNAVIVPEYLLQGAFCFLFLVTGHWVMFLLTMLPTYYNVKKCCVEDIDFYTEKGLNPTNRFMTRQHLIDVTKVFRVLNAEKMARIFKLGFYVVFFAIVIARTFSAGMFSHVLQVFYSNNEELDIRFSVLEF